MYARGNWLFVCAFWPSGGRERNRWIASSEKNNIRIRRLRCKGQARKGREVIV